MVGSQSKDRCHRLPGRAMSLRELAVLLLATALLSSCDLYTRAVNAAAVTPFPDFLGNADGLRDLSVEIAGIADGETNLFYDLAVVEAADREPRLLLLVEPPSSSPDQPFDYRGQLLIFDTDLQRIGTASPGSSLDYFGAPYSYAHDGNMLVAYTVLGPNGEETSVGTLDPNHGLEGFAFTNGTETYLFASPSGDYAAFEIDYAGYNEASWGRFLDGSLDIIPPEEKPDPEGENFDQLGFQLVGLTFNEESADITFVLSEPSEGRIVAARIGLAAATGGDGVLNPNPDEWPVSLEVDRPDIHVDDGGFFMVRRDGWLERYSWNPSGPLEGAGEPLRIVGDRSLSRQYAFASAGPYMYRFDPSSQVLTRYGRWW